MTVLELALLRSHPSLSFVLGRLPYALSCPPCAGAAHHYAISEDQLFLQFHLVFGALVNCHVPRFRIRSAFWRSRASKGSAFLFQFETLTLQLAFAFLMRPLALWLLARLARNR